MTNSFINKVDAQRLVLTTVNGHRLVKAQLTGLSQPAISNWLLYNRISPTHIISKHLVSLSELCQLLSDRSHETFQPIPCDIISQLNLQVQQLQTDLADLMA